MHLCESELKNFGWIMVGHICTRLNSRVRVRLRLVVVIYIYRVSQNTSYIDRTLIFGALFGHLFLLDFIYFRGIVAQLSIGIVFEIQHDYYKVAYLRDVLLKDIRIGTVQNGWLSSFRTLCKVSM